MSAPGKRGFRFGQHVGSRGKKKAVTGGGEGAQGEPPGPWPWGSCYMTAGANCRGWALGQFDRASGEVMCCFVQPATRSFAWEIPYTLSTAVLLVKRVLLRQA